MSNNKFKILIVEDEPTICSFIYTLLDTNGYKTYVAPTCELGKSIFTSYLPDLIILDLGLPDRDGRELIHYVRQKFMTPIIVLSARTTEADKIEALDLGANDYITKPFSTGELLARVRAALRLNRFSSNPTGVFQAQEAFGIEAIFARRVVAAHRRDGEAQRGFGQEISDAVVGDARRIIAHLGLSGETARERGGEK